MPAFEIDPGLLADLKHQHGEISRLEASLQKTHGEITSLCEKLTHAQESLHSQRDAIADARRQFNDIEQGLTLFLAFAFFRRISRYFHASFTGEFLDRFRKI